MTDDTSRAKTPPSALHSAACERLVRHFLTASPPRVATSRHNWILEQSRILQKYVITLAGWYHHTGDTVAAERAWFFIEDALNWEHWYWVDSKAGAYDLTTGEMGVTLAHAAQWLQPVLSGAQTAQLREALRARIIRPYLECVERGAWWHTIPGSNWNPVTNGGACCAAMALNDPSDAQCAHTVTIALDGIEE